MYVVYHIYYLLMVRTLLTGFPKHGFFSFQFILSFCLRTFKRTGRSLSASYSATSSRPLRFFSVFVGWLSGLRHHHCSRRAQIVQPLSKYMGTCYCPPAKPSSPPIKNIPCYQNCTQGLRSNSTWGCTRVFFIQRWKFFCFIMYCVQHAHTHACADTRV